MARDPSQDLSTFLVERNRWGLRWDGAHFVGFALTDTGGELTLMLGAFVCLTDGVRLPPVPSGCFVNAADAVGVSLHVDEDRLPETMRSLAEHELPEFIQKQFYRRVVLPHRQESQSNWYVHFDTRRDRFPRVFAKRGAASEFYKLFGYDCIDRARARLLSTKSGPTFDGLDDLARQLALESHPQFSTSSNPVLDVVAPIPVRLAEFRYDKVAKSYRCDVDIAVSADRSAGLVSLTPGPRSNLALAEFGEVTVSDGIARLRAFFPSPLLKQEIKAALIFKDELLFDEATRPQEPQLLPFRNGPEQEWTRKLEEVFDRPARELSSRIRRVVGRASNTVLQRMREAVEFLEDRPFYSIMATGSVVEALLRARLMRVGKKRLAKALETSGVLLPKKPLSKLDLHQAIEVAESAALVPKMETRAAYSLKQARNSIHISFGAAKDTRYSEAEAIEAVLAMLRLVDALSRRGARKHRGRLAAEAKQVVPSR